MGAFRCAVSALITLLVCPCVVGLTTAEDFRNSHPSLCYMVGQTHDTYVWVDGSICKASAPYHEYVTERPSIRNTDRPIRPSHLPLPARQRTFFRPGSKGGTDPSERRTVGESKPGGPRLDWVLCIRYLAIISGPHRARERRKRFQLSTHPRQIEGFLRPTKQTRWTSDTQHTAHVGRGGGSWLSET